MRRVSHSERAPPLDQLNKRNRNPSKGGRRINRNAGSQRNGQTHCRSARAFAVNPSRLPARPSGLWGLTAQRGQAMGPAVAGCGKSACPVVCPAKAGMYSRRQTCRGRSQSPVVWIAEVMETETLKPIDKVSPRGGYESPGRNKGERVVASKMSIPEGRAFNWRAKAA